MNEKKSGNPWPTRGSKRNDESANEVRGVPPDLVSFENSIKDEGQSCGSSSDGVGFGSWRKQSSSRLTFAKSSGFGSAITEEFPVFEEEFALTTRTSVPRVDRKKIFELEVEKTSAFGEFKSGGFGNSIFPQKEETKAVKSEHLLSKDSGIGSYYAKVDIKEFSEASESNSQLGIKKEPLTTDPFVNRHNHSNNHNHNNQRRRRPKSVRKNVRYEKVCYHCQGSGHYSRFCPQKTMLGDNRGFGNDNANDSNGAKGFFRSHQSGNSGVDYFSAYRYNDEKNEREKSDDQLAKNLDAIFPHATNDEDQKSVLNESFNNQKTQPKNSNNRVPINSLRSSSNVSATFQQPGPSPRSNANLNFDGFCVSPLASPSKSHREPKFETDKESYQTIETRRTIKNPNGQECVEWTCIKFPTSLPPNVKVITAHMLPAQMFN